MRPLYAAHHDGSAGARLTRVPCLGTMTQFIVRHETGPPLCHSEITLMRRLARAFDHAEWLTRLDTRLNGFLRLGAAGLAARRPRGLALLECLILRCSA